MLKKELEALVERYKEKVAALEQAVQGHEQLQRVNDALLAILATRCGADTKITKDEINEALNGGFLVMVTVNEAGEYVLNPLKDE